ncbi:MAG: peptide chain release factor 1, partial [Aeromicrobium sp.]|uniref:peptide chain release factor-like protein n=1 Tax=Aeromicrobium sp. TaxID=1871063 RepID=UPI0026138DD5
LDATESALGGYKSVTMAVKSKGTPEPGEAPHALLKFEGGVHRVQRVPVTESQGRIHTSAAGVLVLAEAEDIDVEINDSDLRIDVYRSSGPGGQSVNTTDSAVRITHVPTGIVASCQNEKSQLQNKEQAMRILRSRLLDAAQAAADAEASDVRKSQIRTVDRSERIRTYNFPENRLSDHRTGFKAYNLDQVMDGALDDVIKSLVDAELAERLSAVESGQ